MSVQPGRNPGHNPGHNPVALFVCAFFWELVLLCLPSEGSAQAHFSPYSQEPGPVLRLEEPERNDVFVPAADDAAMQVAEAKPVAANPAKGAAGQGQVVVPVAVPQMSGQGRPSLTQSTGTMTPAQNRAAPGAQGTNAPVPNAQDPNASVPNASASGTPAAQSQDAAAAGAPSAGTVPDAAPASDRTDTAAPVIATPPVSVMSTANVSVAPDSGAGSTGRTSLTQSTGIVTPARDGAGNRTPEKNASAASAAEENPASASDGVAAPAAPAPQATEPGTSAETPAAAPLESSAENASENSSGNSSEDSYEVSTEASSNPSPEVSGRFEDRTLERTGRRTMPDIIMHYPAFGIALVDRDIEAWVEHIALAFERDLSGESEGGPEAYNVAWLNAACTVRFASPTCVSIVFDVWMHTGGAELSQDVLTLNYNLLTGQRLHIVDIFENVDTALRLLSEAARRELERGAGELMQTDIENGTFPVPENFSSLALTENGVTVNFQPYQVSRLPKAVSVEVPLEELLPAGPLLSLWGKK